CGLRLPRSRRQSEIPILDLVAPAVPGISPREHKSPGAASGEGRSHLPLQGLRLLFHSVPAAVQTNLRHQERLLTGQTLQPRQISLQRLRCFEINVETTKID